jgi:hypothetical protein
MYRLKVFPYKLGSISAKSLANSLGVKRVRPTYDARRRDIIINWGNSRPAGFKGSITDLNTHAAIALACNKLNTFQALEAAGFQHLPLWCTTRYEADQLLYTASEGGTTSAGIYCRTSLTGHSGSGIVIASNTYDLVDAPLYTVGTKHKYEFRVHVFKGKVLDVQQKKRKRGLGPSGSGIRNHSNGWIYARSDISIPSIITEASINAVAILGLDFGAVDIGYRERDGKAFVFEVNTAPGLVGTTLTKYTEAFNNYLEELNG